MLGEVFAPMMNNVSMHMARGMTTSWLFQVSGVAHVSIVMVCFVVQMLEAQVRTLPIGPCMKSMPTGTSMWGKHSDPRLPMSPLHRCRCQPIAPPRKSLS